MTASKRTESTTPAKDGCCSVDIHIENKGDVNIYNCTRSPGSGAEPPPPPKDEHVCPPVAPGACVPASLGAKPKQSRRRKLDKLLANTRVPSTLGASFFHMSRRFLAGKTAAHALEERAFAKLSQLSPDLKRILACSLESFDSLSVAERDHLFVSDLLRDVDQPIPLAELTAAFAREIVDNVNLQMFDDPVCVTERPGQVRTPPFPGGEFPPSPVVICRINGLRTGQFRPTLALGDYTPEEVHQVCHVVLEGDEPKLVCEVQTANCPGTDVGQLCLRVQDVEAGTSVLLEGMNFSSIETKVRLTNVVSSSARDVDATVCGDDETPRTEVINGAEVLITDCRVHDRLTFRVPDDLPPGLYDITVMVPNVGPVAGWGEVLFSHGVRGINVIPSSAARFQIASETLRCINETGSTSIGSDEVGIKIIAVPLFTDLSGGEAQSPNGGEPIRFGDVDSGETRSMDHLLFAHQQPIAGAALSILGYEVDGEDAFENQIDSFTEVFIDILKDQLAFLLEHLKEVEEIAEKLAELGWKGAVVAAVAVAVVLAIDVFVALWAPADLIIEDALGPPTLDLVKLTSVNFPLPLPTEQVTPQGIRVKVTPLDKIPQQYRERREYISDDEDSRYEIVLRYNRLA